MANNSTSFVDASSSHGFCYLSVTHFDPYNNMNRPDSVHPTWTVLATLNGIASPLTVVVNGLIMWVLFGDEDLRSSSFNVLLASLALTDFLVGLVVEPMFCIFHACLMNGCHSPCQLTAHALLTLACCGTTVVTLALASSERYLAIEHPNFYVKNVTGKTVITATIISWIASLACLLFGSVFLYKNHNNLSRIPFAVTIIVSALVVLYCSIKVNLTAYRQSKAIAQQQESVQQPEEHQQQEQRLKEYKRVCTMTMLVVLSVVFYAPFIIVAVIGVVKGEDVTSDFKYIAGPICGTLLNLQSLINPIVMSLRMSYIREGIKNKLAFFTGN